MGIFDKLSKGLASKALENIIQKASGDSGQAAARPVNQPVQPAAHQSTAGNTAANPAEKMNAEEYFAEILASEFSQYQIRRIVPLSEFGGEGRPFDFGLYQDGRLAAVVVLAQRNKTRNHPYWNSQKKAQELNIPFINFHTHMPNERDFVIYRINHMMGQI